MQFPVFETIAEAYRFISSERRDFIAYGALPIVMVALARVLFVLPFAAEAETGGGGLGVARIAIGLVGAVTYIMFAVAWTRRFLGGNAGLSPGAALRWSPRHTRFVSQLARIVLALLPILLVLLVLGGVSGAGATEPEAAARFFLVASAAVIAIGLIQGRLVLVLPAAVTDQPIALHRAWQLTKGNSWRMFWLAMLPSVPLTLAGTIILLILQGIHAAVLGPITPTGPLSSSLVMNLVAQFFSVAGLAATVTTLAIVYRDATAHSARGAGPPATTPRSS